jgi:hypothetical protein
MVGTFLRSPLLDQYCRQNNAKTLRDLHISFNNLDRISSIIQKQKITQWPEGRDLAGVVFEYEQRHKEATDVGTFRTRLKHV